MQNDAKKAPPIVEEPRKIIVDDLINIGGKSPCISFNIDTMDSDNE